eukprot:m.103991 g.103991  ORF g.103991 m.103991 type:complete len:74 (-) comp13830_c1_seq3:16-237(-)
MAKLHFVKLPSFLSKYHSEPCLLSQLNEWTELAMRAETKSNILARPQGAEPKSMESTLQELRFEECFSFSIDQ